MSKAKIASAPNLLTYSVEANLKPTAAYLTEELGVSKAKIASAPVLLALSVESNLKPTAAYLTEELGVSKAKIASFFVSCSSSGKRSSRLGTVPTAAGSRGMSGSIVCACSHNRNANVWFIVQLRQVPTAERARQEGRSFSRRPKVPAWCAE